MLMLTGMIVLAVLWFGIALPLAYLYGKWKFRNWDTTAEAELSVLRKSDEVAHLAVRREARQMKSERRWAAKQQLKIERWAIIGRETARRAQLEDVKA